MKYLVIIRGPLGIGKTTIAKELARKINGEHISIDLVLEKLGLDKIEGESILLKNLLKADESIVQEVKDKLSTKPMVLDGNFYYKEQIEDLIKKLNSKYFVFTLKAPLTVCIERDKNRKNSYGEEAAKAVYKLVSKFDYGININTENKSITEIIKEITLNLKCT